MSYTHLSLLVVLTLIFVLSLSPMTESAAVTNRNSNTEHHQGPLRRVFMKEADASNFFRKRTRRNLKSQDEIDAEQRMVLAADNRKKEFQEEMGNDFGDFDEEEEEDDEESETTTHNTEQWGEDSYEATDPPQDTDGQAA